MVESVAPYVDEVIIVDTGVTDSTLENAGDAARKAGKNLRVVSFKWVNDFAAARNFALKAAADSGADWCLALDSDEWFEANGEDIRGQLERAENAQVRHLMMYHSSGIYQQPRFFRLPAAGKFEGPTHEAYGNWAPAIQLEKARFCDEAKTAAEQKAKLVRDEQILRKHLQNKEHAKNPRWWYYLGDTMYNLRQLPAAIKAFARCRDLKGWDEQGAWASYREGCCWLELAKESKEAVDCFTKFEKALEACGKGLVSHPGIPELAWLAAFVSHEMGRQAQAVCWAKMSIALGKHEGIGKFINRISFTYPMAQWELPYQILESSYRALGVPEEAEKARVKFEIAAKYREAQ